MVESFILICHTTFWILGENLEEKIFANVTRGRQMTDILSTKCIILLPLKIPYKGMLPLLIILTPMISFLFSVLLAKALRHDSCFMILK